eukprot:3957581-Prymnesium_polylepis.2
MVSPASGVSNPRVESNARDAARRELAQQQWRAHTAKHATVRSWVRSQSAHAARRSCPPSP